METNEQKRARLAPDILFTAKRLGSFSTVDLFLAYCQLPEPVIATIIRESGLFDELPNTDKFDPYQRSYFTLKGE